MKSKDIIQKKYKNVTCSKCSSNKIKKDGKRKTQNRGKHGCLESAYAIMKGLEINYNFNRKHMSLDNKTPAEIAIPQLKLGVNKWLDLIRLNSIH